MAHLCLDSSDSRAFGGGSKTIVRGKFAMTTFADLNLAAPLLRALEAAGHTEPTPIQAQAIPSVLEGRDILGIAQTGTGKTAAFALPVLHRLLETPGKPPKKGCRVLVLSPTRELATASSRKASSSTVASCDCRSGPFLAESATGRRSRRCNAGSMC
jgi:superfamily II DNA/RNA helicase